MKHFLLHPAGVILLCLAGVCVLAVELTGYRADSDPRFARVRRRLIYVMVPVLLLFVAQTIWRFSQY